MDTFKLVCGHLCVPIAGFKTEGLCTKIVYSGLGIDTDNMKIHIHQAKVEELLMLSDNAIICEKFTLKRYNIFDGSLANYTRAHRTERAFSRRLH